MKKYLLLYSLPVLCSALCFAQVVRPSDSGSPVLAILPGPTSPPGTVPLDQTQPQVYIEPRFLEISAGVQLGLNFSMAKYDPELVLSPGVNKSNRTGLLAGAFLDVCLGDPFYIQTGVNYLQAGVNYDYSSTGSSSSSYMKVDYLEVPVMLKMMFCTGCVRTYGFAGPALGFRTCATDESTYLGQTQTSDVREFIKTTNFSVNFGAGAQWEMSKKFYLQGDVGYQLGITNINQQPPPTSGYQQVDESLKYNGLQVKFGLGARF